MTDTPKHDVAVVSIGVNAKRFVRECHESMRTCEWGPCTHEAIYVDNGSTDGTLEMMAQDFSDVKVIANGKNLGFCIAANAGCRAASARYYLVINDDVVIENDAVPKLVAYMDANPNVATTGARLVSPDRSDQWSGRRNPDVLSSIFSRRGILNKLFPKFKVAKDYCCKDEVAKGEPFECDWVSAAGQIIRPEPFWAVGGYAEDYYYWHELVLCNRMKDRGHAVALHPGAIILHYEGFGSGPRPFRRQLWHIKDFHIGAYRSYRELHRHGPLHPMSLFTAAALTARATALLVGSACGSLLRGVTRSSNTPGSAATAGAQS